MLGLKAFSLVALVFNYLKFNNMRHFLKDRMLADPFILLRLTSHTPFLLKTQDPLLPR